MSVTGLGTASASASARVGTARNKIAANFANFFIGIVSFHSHGVTIRGTPFHAREPCCFSVGGDLVRSDDEKRARLNCISHLLKLIPYQRVKAKKVKLPKRSSRKKYDDQASLAKRTFVPCGHKRQERYLAPQRPAPLSCKVT